MLNLFTKTLYDKRWFMLGWMLGLGFLAFVMTVFYTSFHQDNGLDQLLKSLPPALKGLVGNLGDLKETATYLGSQLFNIRVPIFVSIFSILLAHGLTVGEEDKGQLRTLLGLPLSRRRIIFDKWLAMIVITGVVLGGLMGGIFVGMRVINEMVDWGIVLNLVLITGLLATALATFIFAVGIGTGKRSLTVGLAVIVAIGSFLLTTFARAVDWLEPYDKASIFHYFPAEDVAHGTVDMFNLYVLAGIIVVSLLLAWLGFRRRDVK
jgi:ABC-2 type transport system permease protein